MNARVLSVLRLVLVGVLLFSGSGQAFAAVTPPPGDGPAGPGEFPPGRPAAGQPQRMRSGSATVNAQAVGGPDAFGYTWSNAVGLPFGCSDQDTGLRNTTVPVSGPIPLGFTFKYYENSYTQVYVSRYGLLGFRPDLAYSSPVNALPLPDQPNNAIMPYWGPLVMDANSRILYCQFTDSGGIHGLMVSWGGVHDTFSNNYFSFTASLYETGDIGIHFDTMNYAAGQADCAMTGMENAYGDDGLKVSWCSPMASGVSVFITRPGASARVAAFPTYQGQLISAGQTVTFTVPFRNIGDLGADIFNLSAVSAWPTTFYLTPGGPSVTNTGSVAAGSSVSVIVQEQVPGGATVGQSNTAQVTATSTLNSAHSKTVYLQAAVPSAFAQVLRPLATNSMSMYLAQPAGQGLRRATAHQYFGYAPAVAEMANGDLAYAWDRYNGSAANIELALMTPYGEPATGVLALTNNSAPSATYDRYPAMAATPDGHLGMAWVHMVYQANGNFNMNVYFAAVDASGNVTYGPANVTNNIVFGTDSTGGMPEFYAPRLAATGDNRFVLAWENWTLAANCTAADCYYDNVYYTVRSPDGTVVKAPTQFTADTIGSSYEGYYDQSVTALSGNRVLLAWHRDSDGDIYYAVLNSAAGLVQAQTDLTGGLAGWSGKPAAAQLSDGTIVVAWTGYSSISTMYYAVLNGSYARIVAPTALTNPASPGGDDDVNVVPDKNGRAILTWADYYNSYHLFYALVDGTGTTLTAPMIFRSDPVNGLGTPAWSLGATTWSLTPASAVSLGLWPDSAHLSGRAGANTTAHVHLANHGLTPASGVVLTATLDSNLSYVGDTSGVAATVNGNQVTWNLPDQPFMGQSEFDITFGVSGGAQPGAVLPVGLAATAAEDGASASSGLDITVSHLVFLPSVRR